MASTRPPVHVRLFRILLRLFPAEFRGDFGEDMQTDFADEYRDARGAGRTAAGVWGRALPGLIVTAVRQHASAFGRDARFALRLMARTPVYTSAAVLMIALGTGANAAMFSIVDAVLLRSPFAHPDRVVGVLIEGTNRRATAAISRPEFDALRERGGVFESIAALGSSRAPILSGVGEPQRFAPECVTASTFRVLGTPPLAGRTFSDEEERSGAAVVVISYRFWQRVLAGAPDAVGRQLDLNGVPTTVVGIMPHGFAGPYSHDAIDGWLPITLPPIAQAARRQAIGNEMARPACVPLGTLNVFARLTPALPFGAAARQATDAAGIDRIPDWQGRTGGRVRLEQLENVNVTELRTPLLALVGAVGCVLLIACANVANLQLERAVGRHRELAIRLAIGATRGRLLRQTLTETLVLYLVGGAAGAVAAMWTLHAIVALLPIGVPHVDDVAMSARVLTATLVFACAAGLAVGLVPALTTTSVATIGELKISTPTGSRTGTWIRRALVTSQVALSLTLLVGAGLMVRTFLTLRPVRPGFTASDKITVSVQQRSPDAVRPSVFFRRLFDRLQEIPGTQAVSGSTYLPMSGVVTSGMVSAGETTLSAWEGTVTPNYFAEMQIPIVRGRAFAATDDDAAPAVTIVNETFARRTWADHDPIGEAVTVRGFDGMQFVRHVVGVVRDTRSLGGDLKTRPELYVPFAQDGLPFLYVIVRTADPFDARLPGEIRAAAAALDPLQVVDHFTVLQTMLDDGVSTPRFGAWLLAAFAAMALLLAAVGLAASIAWGVAQRSREIGVRMALGARGRDVVAMFLKQGLGVTLAGIVFGLAGAAASTRLLQSWLYGVTPLDGRAFAGSAVGMLVIAALATYLPARRAAGVDPVVTLRTE